MDETTKKIIELHKDGKSIREIARITFYSKSNIQRVLKRWDTSKKRWDT